MAYQWYAIQTYSGSEQSVKRAIEQLVVDYGIEEKLERVVVPTEEVIEVKDGKKKITERTLYSGYAFAHIDLDTDLWHKIQSLPRVSRFIGEQKTPTALSAADIKVILDKMEKKSAPRPKVDFETGEMVRIVDGPFANFTAMVEEYDLDHGKLRLNVSIFGRNTPVEILYTQVEKIL
ncbi:MAG TPA: transcription termination/antitermination protein NusG [Sulfurovum sp.]|jgi:transcriptional antiterminator NusG|nr:MAG: transcription termination/antitermination protein NusG [Sulfurovum sp. 35-42-20]OYZ26452.1 MAG: transcription termination/antitermination protein NusG [Sulfurovum sp. 16-42-52]OYZ50108.1 MAG: transcription termination/antitermination protein NusG [Sulfurovum sp. 24-42-9]OZA46346.1 MAG: transcription termination/antitermination protein NusG [Sulfurovum sp. 17-42-90]OZA60439.1 MAG: transcription termination/antitermination protein NusG [Sulfurovum sp. 39-42-12]HQR73224.1 transcription te